MPIRTSLIIWASSILVAPAVIAETRPAPEIETLRAEIAALRQEYEDRIRDLENRVAAAEQKSPTADAAAAPAD